MKHVLSVSVCKLKFPTLLVIAIKYVTIFYPQSKYDNNTVALWSQTQKSHF